MGGGGNVSNIRKKKRGQNDDFNKSEVKAIHQGGSKRKRAKLKGYEKAVAVGREC